MARRRHRPVKGQSLVYTDDFGDVLHSDQVTTGKYGSQKGRTVAKEDLDGPSSVDQGSVPRRARPKPEPAGSERVSYEGRDASGNLGAGSGAVDNSSTFDTTGTNVGVGVPRGDEF